MSLCHSEGALFATEESYLPCQRFFAAAQNDINKYVIDKINDHI